MLLSANKYSPQDAIDKLLEYKFNEGYELNAIHEYSNVNGDVEYWRVRLKQPNSRDKCILPVSVNSDGHYELKEPKYAKGKKPIYNLREIIACKNEPIVVVEGESCVDKLSGYGVVATTSGSWNSAHGADWTSLSGKKVIIWPDADDQGNRYAKNVASILMHLNCKVEIIDVVALKLKNKDDCVDWIKFNPLVTKAEILMLPLVQLEIEELPNDSNTKSAMLLELVTDVEFFHDEQSTTYATIGVGDHEETWPISSKHFQNWLSQLFWYEHNESLSSFAKASAIDVMDAKARYEGECHKVFTRVGKLGEETYVYLANEDCQVVKISKEGWLVLEKSPVKFVKNKNMKPLPTPIADSDLSLIWNYVNVPPKYRVLIVAWVLESLRLDTEYPILMLYGCQGSAKSTSQEFLRALIDPNVANLRGAPRNADDIIVAAANNYVISYNNISNLTKNNQDDMCAVSTGGGVGKRKNYTDLEESLCDIKRPLIMNGIHNPITATDLTSRCIAIELPEISDTCRKLGSELRKDFIHDHPNILGALYDYYVSVLNILPSINLLEMPRLADFALFGTAVEKVMGLEQGAFMSVFNDNIEDSMLNTIDSKPVLWSLNKFVKDKQVFSGTYGELLDALNSTIYKSKASNDWPGSAKALAQVLKDAALILFKMGIYINFLSARCSRGILVEIGIIL